MKVLDTSVVIDHLRGHSVATDTIDRLLTAGEELVASEVVRFEVYAGARSEELPQVDRFADSLGWIAVTGDVARTAAGLARRHRAGHSGIDDVDYLVAATALLLDAELLTVNVRHFPMFEGLAKPY